MTDIQDPEARLAPRTQPMPHKRRHFVAIEVALWSVAALIILGILVAATL